MADGPVLGARDSLVFRGVGNAVLAIAAILCDRVVFERHSLADVFAIGLGVWAIVSWAALLRMPSRLSAAQFTTGVTLADIVVWTVLIGLTNADASLLLFVILLRAVDMRTASFRAVLLFGHAAVACYGLLVLHGSTVHRPGDRAAEFVKVGLLYLAAIYLAFTARASEAVAAARRRDMALRTTFLANVSHELRTPLNGVIGGTRLLESTDLNPAQRHHVGIVRVSAETVLQLVEEILDVAKLEVNKLHIDSTPFPLRATLAEALRPITPRADVKGLVLRLRVEDEVPEALIGDPVRLRQIIVNLVENAIKFTQDGEIEVRASVEPGEMDNILLHIAVRDTGIGVPAERRQAIFEAFTQADGATARTYGGSGLGLTISSRLATLMGGRLWLESEVGRGSTFHVTVRCALAPPRNRPPAPGLAGLTVLVAEPNQAHRASLVDMLHVWGMTTMQAENGNEVMSEIARAHDAGRPYDLLFLGIDLIGEDGLRIVERLRMSNSFAGPIIMLMRAVARRGDRERCAELGVSAVVTRPFSQSEVFDALALALGGPVTPAPLVRPRRVLSILLADDNAVNREVAIGYLTGLGHGVTAVHDGREALAALERGGFDVALLDLHMPGADGFEVTREIRRREAATGRKLAIVAMTAQALDGDREQCLAAGMDDYVAKPVQAERLFQALERVTATAPDFETALLERAAGDAVLQERVARLFLTHAPEARARLHAALDRRDAAAVVDTAHWLKGAVGNFPAPAASEAAAQVETFGRSGDLEAAATECAKLDVELDRLAAALAAVVGRQAR